MTVYGKTADTNGHFLSVDLHTIPLQVLADADNDYMSLLPWFREGGGRSRVTVRKDVKEQGSSSKIEIILI
jgi:hypothetical protein